MLLLQRQAIKARYSLETVTILPVDLALTATGNTHAGLTTYKSASPQLNNSIIPLPSYDSTTASSPQYTHDLPKMTSATTISPAYDPLSQYGPYSSSIASSASASTSSVWSGFDSASQTSDDASLSTSSESDSCHSYFASRGSSTSISTDHELPGRRPDVLSRQRQLQQVAPVPVVPSELRQNPRRTAAVAGGAGCPPPLLSRQPDRKVNFVDSLVGTCLSNTDTVLSGDSLA